MGVGDEPGPFHEAFTKSKQWMEHVSAKIKAKYDEMMWRSLHEDMQSALKSTDRRRIGSSFFDWEKGEMFLIRGGSFDVWMVFASAIVGEAYAWELPIETYYYGYQK
jgi:hypothetical protein